MNGLTLCANVHPVYGECVKTFDHKTYHRNAEAQFWAGNIQAAEEQPQPKGEGAPVADHLIELIRERTEFGDNPLTGVTFHFGDGLGLYVKAVQPVPQTEAMPQLGRLAAKMNLDITNLQFVGCENGDAPGND